jgi:hypothetical protein
MSSNGGFPPLKIIKNNKHDKHDKTEYKKKDKNYKKDNINLSIKNILSNSIVKPMIDLNKPPVDKVIDSL